MRERGKIFIVKADGCSILTFTNRQKDQFSCKKTAKTYILSAILVRQMPTELLMI